MPAQFPRWWPEETPNPRPVALPFGVTHHVLINVFEPARVGIDNRLPAVFPQALDERKVVANGRHARADHGPYVARQPNAFGRRKFGLGSAAEFT